MKFNFDYDEFIDTLDNNESLTDASRPFIREIYYKSMTDGLDGSRSGFINSIARGEPVSGSDSFKICGLCKKCSSFSCSIMNNEFTTLISVWRCKEFEFEENNQIKAMSHKTKSDFDGFQMF